MLITCTYMCMLKRVSVHVCTLSHIPFIHIYFLAPSSHLSPLPPSFPPHTHTHSSTASSMRTTTDPADFLRNPIRYVDSFNLTNSTLAQFTPNNSVIFLGTHKISFTSEVAEELNYTSDDSPLNNTEASGGVQFPFPDLDTIERLYRTPFHRERISDELSTYWDVAKDDQIQLPAKNQYIPEDFTIYPRSVNDSDNPKKLNNPDNDDRPISMWWLLDTDDFHEPRVNVMCQLNNTNAGITAAWEGKSLMILYGRNLRGRKALSVGDYGATVGVISNFNLPNMSMFFSS